MKKAFSWTNIGDEAMEVNEARSYDAKTLSNSDQLLNIVLSSSIAVQT